MIRVEEGIGGNKATWNFTWFHNIGKAVCVFYYFPKVGGFAGDAMLMCAIYRLFFFCFFFSL